MRVRYTEIHRINSFFSINFFFDFSSKLHFFFLSILFPFPFSFFISYFYDLERITTRTALMRIMVVEAIGKENDEIVEK